MKTNNLRNRARRFLDNRRNDDRRKVTHDFGTEEWIENVKLNYFAWPRHDRRLDDRRSDERRASERRIKHQVESRDFEQHHHNVLTQEERKMINHLYLNDDEPLDSW